MLWRRKKRTGPDEPTRQLWSRTPSPLDAVTGYVPDLDQVDESRPPRVYADEIDPSWADTDAAADPNDPPEHPREDHPNG